MNTTTVSRLGIPRLWCTISAVENGWLVQITPPHYECGEMKIRGDDMLVFTNVENLSEWVRKYFSGHWIPVHREDPPDPPTCPP